MKLWIAALFFLLAWLLASEGLGFLATIALIVLVVLALAGFYDRPAGLEARSDAKSEPWRDKSAWETQEKAESHPWADKSAWETREGA